MLLKINDWGEEQNTQPMYANCADTAEHLMLSLQLNIPFVSESCRGEHKNKKRLDGEMQDEVK